LPELLMVYNASPSTATNLSPHYLIFGRESQLPIDFLLDRVQESGTNDINWVEEHVERLKAARGLAEQRIVQAAIKRKQKADEKLPAQPIRVGDVVRKHLHHLGRAKIQNEFSNDLYVVTQVPPVSGGPFVIKLLVGDGTESRVAAHEIKLAERGAGPPLPVDLGLPNPDAGDLGDSVEMEKSQSDNECERFDMSESQEDTVPKTITPSSPPHTHHHWTRSKAGWRQP
jgi:hypothetical protein